MHTRSASTDVRAQLKDLDVWVWEASVENAPKVMKALREFGAPLMGLTEHDLETPEAGLQIGREPLRIDVLTKISGLHIRRGVAFTHTDADFGDSVRCPVIGLEALIANKRAAGRPQDLADVAALENIRAAKGR